MSGRLILRKRELPSSLYPYKTSAHNDDTSPKRYQSRTPSKEDVTPR